MSRQFPSDDDHTDTGALSFPSNRPPSASSEAHAGERPPLEEQLRLVTSARLRLRLSRERFDSARTVFYSMKRAVDAASEELASSRREVAAATGAAAELGALPTEEERRQQQKQPPPAREEGGAHCGYGRRKRKNSDGASYGAPPAPPRTAAESCVDAGCDTVLVVRGCGVAGANGSYARTTKTANGQPVYALAGRWKSKEVHYVVYKQFKMTDDWTLGIHPKRTMTEFEPCTYYYKLYR